MKNYIGIDLGTTNSAICSYNGSNVRIWKSPEQNDVTPSVIYIDRRSKYIGRRAYDSAPFSPGNAASLFKRQMGTSTPIKLSAVNLTKTPEECSAEILKTLFGYLPEEVRNNPDTGTVITVPAAFNQMQKDATMQAAEMAGIGKIALMQEPVAAVMCVMRARKGDGTFLIYDFGGGTLDIAIAQSIGGSVSIQAHGGIQMCGGRDFDRMLVDNVIKPWLLDNFDLPEDFSVNPQFKSIIPIAAWATERAKIELSSRDESAISLGENEIRIRDAKSKDIYLDIPLKRETLDQLISNKISESIDAARETISKAGLTAHDLEKIVFIGGPTNYKPLRDKVSFELGIPGSTEVNPMTAVAEGACIFAESIDWSAQDRSRKSSRGKISSSKLSLSFSYIARTPDIKAKIAVQITGKPTEGSEFQVDSIDTGWTSGRLPLKHGAMIEVTLSQMSENVFKVFVFDPAGGPIGLENDKIIITRTAATIDAIPASHSISIEVLNKIGGVPILDYLIKAGDMLPKKGKIPFKSAVTLKAGDPNSILFKLWEGEIDDPISDNRDIGVFKVSGSDFESGVIPAGADIECEYEILDSGNIVLEVSIPCISGSFHSGKNFYSRQEGQIDYTSAYALVEEEMERTLKRIEEISQVVDDPRIEQAKEKLNPASSLDPQEGDPSVIQQAHEGIRDARKTLAKIRKDHLKEIRQLELDGVVAFFDKCIREHAKPSEAATFDNLAKTAQRSIDIPGKEFEHYIDELKGKNFEILWRQDWFVIERFKHMINSPHLFVDKAMFEKLSNAGTQAMRSDDIGTLRKVVANLSMIRTGGSSDDEIFESANIVRG